VPGVLGTLLREAIECFIDVGLKERVDKAREEAKARLGERRQEIMARHPETAALAERVEALAKEVNQVSAKIELELQQERPERPERPEAEEPQGLDEEPLYDSGRDYIQQRDTYLAWKRKGA
jgi:uncharacterized membrane-anchored protein YhcB (DUF1043 family)